MQAFQPKASTFVGGHCYKSFHFQHRKFASRASQNGTFPHNSARSAGLFYAFWEFSLWPAFQVEPTPPPYAKKRKCLCARNRVEAALAFLGVKVGSKDLLAHLSQVLEPGFVLRAKLFFQLFTQALRKGGAFSGGGNGDLQGPALDYRGVVEIAKFGDVHDVAAHAAAPGFAENLPVQFCRRRCGHHQEHALQVGRLESPLLPIDLPRGGPRTHRRRGLGSHDANARAGDHQALNLGLRDGSGADDQAVHPVQLQEHWEEARGLFGSAHGSRFSRQERSSVAQARKD